MATSTSYQDYVTRGGERGKEAVRARRMKLRKLGWDVVDWSGCVNEYDGTHFIPPEPEPEIEEPAWTAPPSPAKDDPDAWARYFLLIEELAERRRNLSDNLKSIDWTAPDDLPFAVVFIGDTHIGSRGVDYGRLRADLEFIAAVDGLWAVHMGDVTDNYQLGTKAQSGLYDTLESNPQEQLRHAEALLGIAAGKWLAILAGNHDGWTYKTSGHTPLPAMAEKLGAPYVSESGAMLKLSCAGERWRVLCKHQFRGGSGINKSASANKLWTEWPWDGESADVVCLAHTHEPDMHHTLRRGEPVVLMRSGTYKVHDPYSESAGYRPGYGVGLVIFDPLSRQAIPFHPSFWRVGVQVLRGMREEL